MRLPWKKPKKEKPPMGELELRLSTTDVEWNGNEPTFSGNMVNTSARGGDARSEVYFETPQDGRLRLGRYTTTTATFEAKHTLANPVGGAMPASDNWYVLYQTVGPTLSNTWPGPPIAVTWENGTYRIGGGAAAPNASGGFDYKGSWATPYVSAPLDTWRHFKVTIYMDGPGSGWCSMWIDGVQRVNKWKPTAGTFYTDAGSYSTKDLQTKVGLYTGTNSPAWTRQVQHRNIGFEWTAGGVTKSAQFVGAGVPTYPTYRDSGAWWK